MHISSGVIVHQIQVGFGFLAEAMRWGFLFLPEQIQTV